MAFPIGPLSPASPTSPGEEKENLLCQKNLWSQPLYWQQPGVSIVFLLWRFLPLGPGSPSSPGRPLYPGGPRAPGCPIEPATPGCPGDPAGPGRPTSPGARGLRRLAANCAIWSVGQNSSRKWVLIWTFDSEETECYGNGLTVDHRPTQLPDVLLTGQFTLKTEFKRKPQESHSERAFIL